MAVVGGLVAGFSAAHAESHQNATAWQRFQPNIFFNLGRVISYAVFGALIGAFGSVFKISGGASGFLIAAAGFLMLYMGLKLTGISPRFSAMSIALPKKLSKKLGITDSEGGYSHTGTFIAGGLTFFLPCGFTQAMQLYAITTGSALSGAIIMFLFALGTVPGLLSVGAITSVLKGSTARVFFRVIGVVVIALGFFNIASAYNLSGLNLPLPSIRFPSGISGETNGVNKAGKNGTGVSVENGVQIVKMDQIQNGYSPNSFVVKKGIPVKWIITSKSSYTCAASLVMPAMGISTTLKPGINTFEFTPTKAGILRFTCGMGMYSGKFTVID
jgi:sulfite exporter TauE/SafE/plastocyanin